ncbi:MAG: type II toxin-antitoxin system ParD family antitoxin [Pseudomonadota bacterium]
MATTVRKTITLTDEMDAWIKRQIDAGQYTTDSEYIRALVRADQGRSGHDAAIRAALIAGEESGPGRPFDAAAFKARMAAKRGG